MDKLKKGIEKLRKEVAPGFESYDEDYERAWGPKDDEDDIENTYLNPPKISKKELAKLQAEGRVGEGEPLDKLLYKAPNGQMFEEDEAYQEAYQDFLNASEDLKNYEVGSEGHNRHKGYLLNALDFLQKYWHK